MATGTTSNFVLKRNQLVRDALLKVRAIKHSQQSDYDRMRSAIHALNNILREEDNDQTGIKRSLWATKEDHLFIQAGNHVYSSTDGLATDILNLQEVAYRDINGDDVPAMIINDAQYEKLSPKNEVGDVEKVYLKPNIDRSLQTLSIWPCPDSIGTVSQVAGSDSLQYKCILKHTSALATKPITGSSYRLYWKQTGSGGSAWAVATAYTNSVLLRYKYKRPLFDFDLPDDDPDVPAGWSSYLMWRLAYEIAPEYKIVLEEQNDFLRRFKMAEEKLFPTLISRTQDVHNKARFF